MQGALDGAEEFACSQDGGAQQDNSDRCGDDGVVRGEPGEPDGYGVLGGAEGDVGDGLRTGGDGGADGGLGGVGSEGDGGAKSCGENLHLRSEL